MSKPKTVDDLDDYTLAAHAFITADTQFLMRDITVGHAFLALLEALRNSPEFDLSEDGEIKATVALTDDEKASKLRSAQDRWETVHRWYQEADEKHVESWKRYSIDQWAKDEGLDPIDWEQHDATQEAVSHV